jgi:hypothetical protein
MIYKCETNLLISKKLFSIEPMPVNYFLFLIIVVTIKTFRNNFAKNKNNGSYK